MPCIIGDLSAQCGSLSVYEDRAAQKGRLINLRVAVIKARDASPSPDPIFWLAGGPGGSAIEDASYAMLVLGASNEQHDLVFVDQRGTGSSNELICAQPADSAYQVDALRACLASLEADPGAYTTAWAMDDIDDVRAALGYDQINLYGESYGATSAQVYLLRHGAHVRTISLAGASLLDVPMFERYPLSSQKALDYIFARCAADPRCHSAFPNLRQEFVDLMTHIEQDPLTLPLSNSGTGQPLVLTDEMARVGIHNLLVRTETAAMLPALIHLLYTQDLNGAAAYLAPLMNSSSTQPPWKVTNLVILCHEDWAQIHQAETDVFSASSYLNYMDVHALTLPEEICAVIPKPQPDALYGHTNGSHVPMLILNGEADPQDPPRNVADAKQFYPNSVVLVAPGQGHGYTGITCRSQIIGDFISRGTMVGVQTGCLDQVELPDFME
jgi:pimeloyl-ACP methyl ester carboxylesterase